MVRMSTSPPPVAGPGELFHLVRPGTDVVVPMSNGEPRAFLDELEARADDLADVRIHQMHPVRARRFHGPDAGGVRYVSYFLSPLLRDAFAEGHVDLVPNDFHAVPSLVRRRSGDLLLVVAASPPDRHGFVSMGVTADYAAALLGECPVVVEVNPSMPRVAGLHNFPLSMAEGWYEADTPLVPLPEPEVTEVDRAIAELVAAEVPDGATLQIGIGAVPGLVAGLLGDHRGLGVHTELLGDSVMRLVDSGAVSGHGKVRERGLVTTTTALGSSDFYDWMDQNGGVFLLPVDISNDPRIISSQPKMCAINATMQVDLLGQCASESLGHHYVSSTGGQADFLRGAQLCEDGRSFIVTHSTAVEGTVSRIVPSLSEGAVVTAHKNLIDRVVTEYGIAELTGLTIRDRAEALIGIAHPDFRDGLSDAADRLGYR